MRLLERSSRGEFSLTKDLVSDDEIPPYAILSHTWGAAAEEVAFQDLINGTGMGKTGYEKIRFCGEQARRDGLHYFWVDTCCIDKSNSVELQEAINSMFCWYQNAAKCYVYLSDVSTTKRKASDRFSKFAWESAFRASRWFTRGWTLQELLAPSSVEFFSREGKRLGDKRTLERQIHEITGIAIPALRGAPPSQFGVDERLSWAKNRQTTRKEDAAYSLLGIFDVYMPLIYGEGRDNAFTRLREEIDKPSKALDHLPYAVEAPFNSYAKQHSPSCLPNTRVDLLREIYGWADGQDERCIFWLNGLAGTGKSTIARTVARRYFDQNGLGASFFFSRGGGDVGRADRFVTSIVVQLASSVRTVRRYISDAVAEHSDIASRSLHDQWRQLVIGPLSKLDGNSCRTSYVLVVDALDECDDDNNIRIILQLLAEARSLKRVRLRVFVTSRPEVPIRYGFHQMSETEHQDFVLHNISPSIIDHDIRIFLEYNLRLIRQERCLDVSWPGEEIVRCLVRNASGLFIWAETACRFIREGKRFAVKRLSTILDTRSSSITAPEKQLDEIYLTLLKHSISPDYSNDEKEESCNMLRCVLGSIMVLLSPLSISSLSGLLHIPKDDVNQTLEDLHAILDIPNDHTRPLQLHHPSFRDFLLDKNRCVDSNFWVDEKKAHRILANSCIQLMSTSLKQDICGVDSPGQLATDVERSRVEQCLLPEVQYACLCWVQHLQKGGTQLHDNDQVQQFLKVHLLHWLEALGWMRRVPDGIHAISLLESIPFAHERSTLREFIHDIKRFALYNRPGIEQAPLQTYCSALIFAPTMSIVRKQFEDRMPRWMRRLPRVEEYWNALLQTLEGHTLEVTAVAFSPDGKLLASASWDRAVRLWDAGSGATWQRLAGHSGPVEAVAFSPDGKLLASVSWDQTVILWDASSGALRQRLEGHSGLVKAVAFSPDGKLLASASRDGTVRLWDAGSGAPRQRLEGYEGCVDAVAFSPDSKLLASDWRGGAVRLWDAGSGAPRRRLEGHSDSVKAVAFSPDGKLLASASWDKTVILWDVGLGAPRQRLKAHSDSVNAVAFSPDGKLLASASWDRTVRLWDTGSEVPRQSIKAHSDSVNAVAFSPDGKLLASASRDGNVRLWDAGLSTSRQSLEGHSDWINAVAFSPDGKLLASASEDRTVRLWDAGSGAPRQSLKGHSNSVNAVAFSPDGKLLASASRDRTVWLWDAGSGAPRQRLWGHLDWVWAVAFSPNGKLLASASGDGTVRLWDAGSGAPRQKLKGHSGALFAVAFSPDGKLVASASEYETVILWNAGSGAALRTIEVDDVVEILSFTEDGTALRTDRGLVFTGSSPSATPSQPSLSQAVFVKDQWVGTKTENMLWLPSGCRPRRPSRAAVHENFVAVGSSSGRVVIFECCF